MSESSADTTLDGTPRSVRVLVVDNDIVHARTMGEGLERLGYHVVVAGGGNEGAGRLAAESLDGVVTDLMMNDIGGLEILKKAKEAAAETEVIVVTGHGTIPSAVEAMQQGAFTYLQKPLDLNHLRAAVEKASAGISLRLQNIELNRRLDERFGFEGVVGSSPQMLAVIERLKRIAPTDATVLIPGATGTGKELAAREVHRLGRRADRPIVTVNCAAIPDTLIESELFGYEKGAFTGATSNRSGLIEAADGGTLFLDEIGELPLAAQARLLRYIQEGEIRRIGSVTSKKVDARLICATHRNLRMLSDSGQFREDLFYRIDVLRLDIPALRERGADIVDMAEWLIERQANKLGMMTKPLSQRSLELLERHRWPGNVRELQNVIERALVMSTSGELELTVSNEVETTRRHNQGGLDVSQDSPELPTSNELSLEDYFQRFVLEHQDAMNETELAQKLGISRKCLWERRQRFGLPRQKQKSA